MQDPHAFLTHLAVVLGVAGLTSFLFQRLRLPVVLGYILAGLIIGPHVPVPLVADPVVVSALSELGVILVMFSLGLEFSLGRLLRVGPSAGIVALIQVGIVIWLGFNTGRLLGWGEIESLFVGATLAISSTTIIARTFQELRPELRLREVVFGVLICQDLLAVLILATLASISLGSGFSAAALGSSAARLIGFLVVAFGLGLFVVPSGARAIVRLGRPETTLVTSIGLCFAMALLARGLGYSVALGAFVAGSLVAESGVEARIAERIEPVRDVFAAIFFVAVGMSIDPALIAKHAWAVAALTGVVIVGQSSSVALGGFLTGNGVRTSIQAGMSLAQIGEFSFIIAGLGLSAGATREFFYPVVVSVSALTMLLTPWLIRASGPVASFVDRRLPAPLQTFVTLYGAWIERLGSAPRREGAGAELRRRVRWLLVDTALLAGIVAATPVAIAQIAAAVEARAGIGSQASRVLVFAASAVLSVPFLVGILRCSRSIALTLATRALPSASNGQVDLADAPRRAFVWALQLASLLAVGVPLAAITQPFLPPLPGALMLLGALGLVGVALWRSAANLEGHVRAGAEMILEALAKQSAAARLARPSHDLASVSWMIPGLGEPVLVRLEATSHAAGKTLADLDLRARTGATVLAVRRGEASVAVPAGDEVLRAGDVLVLTGTHGALEAATQLLRAC